MGRRDRRVKLHGLRVELGEARLSLGFGPRKVRVLSLSTFRDCATCYSIAVCMNYTCEVEAVLLSFAAPDGTSAAAAVCSVDGEGALVVGGKI